MTSRFDGIGMTSMRTRSRMVERLRERGIRDEELLAVMGSVPRHLFVDEALASRAYEDIPLPLGFGQTISSPYTVARMTEVLRNGRALKKVLEVGTGCGYQTAVLARLAKEVYSVERIGELLKRARTIFRDLRIYNVRLKHGDGQQGIPEAAPFDGIIVTAAIPHVPRALTEQLEVGGRMVLPLGAQEQVLYLIERTECGARETVLESVKFVPLVPGVVS
ncbi:protein-L-isoaspartate(D-aspartate) O-methyltransferase [Pelomicrobium methylotrophicum]|uniref:Protein-L-isoaspartate O-methyltransferase n=1 Tax=Pelomicrobium methylotrophicum TaxID=2602750 RepID=A0A5C7ESM9_9PROT|nr:protein-L-isoaspartate(D-aspartate) O-methyltransferase [Pelomicrobium methylotrophicum]TXF11681.1 protein-L-isoaspartate(D-aspartate) O-methyltransferase [Pelomicrobium methylotrophicum]